MRDKTPPQVEGLQGDYQDWYRIQGAETWIAVQEPIQERPAGWKVPHLMLTKGPGPDEFSTWKGAPDEPGRYRLWRPR